MKKNVILLILILIPLCGCYEIRCIHNNIRFDLKGLHSTIIKDSSDKIYKRKKILKTIGKSLYTYNIQHDKKYGLDKIICDYCFYKNYLTLGLIWDLTVMKNKSYNPNTIYHFKNYHIYSVKPIIGPYNFEIVALINGKIVIYDVYNIETRENQIEDIIEKLKSELPKEFITDDLIERIRHVEANTSSE